MTLPGPEWLKPPIVATSNDASQYAVGLTILSFSVLALRLLDGHTGEAGSGFFWKRPGWTGPSSGCVSEWPGA